MGTTTEYHGHDVERTQVFDDPNVLKDDAHATFEENTPAEKALVRKIDLYLMPSIWFLYLLAVSKPCWQLDHSTRSLA